MNSDEFREGHICETCAWTPDGEDLPGRPDLADGTHIRRYYCHCHQAPCERLAARVKNRYALRMESCSDWERQIPEVSRGRDFAEFCRAKKESSKPWHEGAAGKLIIGFAITLVSGLIAFLVDLLLG